MPELLKDRYNAAFVERLSIRLKDAYPSFDIQAFTAAVFDANWPKRELKDRMRHFSTCLHQAVPEHYAQQLEIFKQVIWEGQALELMFFPDFVELYGMENLQTSLAALEYFTPFASAEFAIRPFLLKYPEAGLQQMITWSKHSNLHLRRLASEGCRPRLPWAMALKDYQKDPSPILPILHQLYQDESEYVRRSVANNLNDISKDHPELAYSIAKEWLQKDPSKNTRRLVKHALRGLLKQGHTQALLLFGFADPQDIQVVKVSQSKNRLAIGDTLSFQVELENTAKTAQLIRLEYGIDFVKKNGKTSRKVFQWSEKEIEPGIHSWSKQQAFANLSTRKHYPGTHRLWILVNGQSKGHLDFDLIQG